MTSRTSSKVVPVLPAAAAPFRTPLDRTDIRGPLHLMCTTKEDPVHTTACPVDRSVFSRGTEGREDGIVEGKMRTLKGARLVTDELAQSIR